MTKTYDFSELDVKVKARGGRVRKSTSQKVNAETFEPLGAATSAFGVDNYAGVKIGGVEVQEGDLLKFSGQGNKKFSFKSLSVNQNTGASWVKVEDSNGINRALNVANVKQVG